MKAGEFYRFNQSVVLNDDTWSIGEIIQITEITNGYDEITSLKIKVIHAVICPTLNASDKGKEYTIREISKFEKSTINISAEEATAYLI